jgi:hypothetical protein
MTGDRPESAHRGHSTPEPFLATTDGPTAHAKQRLGSHFRIFFLACGESQNFDLVTLVTVLAFVPEPDFAAREIARVLEPGG